MVGLAPFMIERRPHDPGAVPGHANTKSQRKASSAPGAGRSFWRTQTRTLRQSGLTSRSEFVAYWPMEDSGDDPALPVVDVEMLNRIAQQASETMAAFMGRLPEARIPPEYIERPDDDDHTRWRRRAEYARFLRRPLRVTPEQHDEIRRLEPYAGLRPYDLQRIALFGVPLVVEEPQPEICAFERHYLDRWADADRIQLRAEFMAERAIAGHDGIV